MKRLAVWIFACVGPISVGACGGGTPAHAVRPNDPTASQALGESSGAGGGASAGSVAVQCSSAPTTAEPLVVDWKSSEQLDLSVAMQKNVAVVAYDCKSIRLLKNCTAKGKYTYTGVSSVIQEAVKIEDADEVKASLPLAGAALSGEVARGSSIDIALAYVGKQSSLDDALARSDLTGSDCNEATHFVHRATIGAFAMATGTRGQARAAAEIFSIGASAGSSSTKKKLNSAGDVNACKPKDGADRPPEGCGAVLRLELQALGGGRVEEKHAPLPNTCPDGFAPSGGRCAKRSGAAAYRCDMTDPEECKAQCKKGNADSCYNAGTIAKGHDPKPVTKAFFTKACAGNVARGCFELTDFIEKMPDWPEAWSAAEKGCNLGHADSCWWLGRNGDNGGMAKGIDARAGWYKKACDLGDWRSCKDVAEIWLEGEWKAQKRTPEALKILDTACAGGRFEGCLFLAKGYKDGQPFNDPTDMKPDPAKFEAYRAKACATTAGKKSDIGWLKCK